jgi:RNA ligase (TIGR02306 family)
MGTFKEGDLCVYIPIDSILPPALETLIFGPDAKVKLTKSRVRTIKLRGAISQGMCLPISDIKDFLKTDDFPAKEGKDVTALLGITKYEPPEISSGPMATGGSQKAKKNNPYFHKYTGLENAKNYPDIFSPGELVSVTEKLHGTNFRAGYVPTHANTVLKKIKKFLGLLPKYEFVYGSHNVQLQDKHNGGNSTWLQTHGKTTENVYAEAVRLYDLRSRLKPGEVVYGEIVGDAIQNGYTYGCKPGERELVLFDLMFNGQYVDADEFASWCIRNKFDRAPEVFRGPFDLAAVKELTKGDSVYAPCQRICEGVVVKPLSEQTCFIGRKALKVISDAYLLKDQSDFH